MEPRTVGVADRSELADRVDGSGVDVARLATDDRRLRWLPRQHTLEIVRIHSAVGIHSDTLDRVGAETQ